MKLCFRKWFTKVNRNKYVKFAFCIYAIGCKSAYADNTYTVRQINEHNDLEISLYLPENTTVNSQMLFARGTFWGLKEQVRLPHCSDGTLLEKNNQGYWVAPAGCKQIAWLVSLPVISDYSFDVSSQSSAFMNTAKWTLLSEPTSLLRLKTSTPQQNVLLAADTNMQLVGATPIAKNEWLIPEENNAPEFYVIGASQVENKSIGKFNVQYIADNMYRIQQLGLMDLHEKALKYLSGVIYGYDQIPENDRSLLVLWVGIDAQHGNAGGAAGRRSFIANYVIGDEKNSLEHTAQTLMILAHEQFHQLTDARRGNLPALPNWINESLAQYYGLRSVQLSINNKATSEKLVHRFIDSNREVKVRFTDINALFNDNRPLALDVSYQQGATFWAEIDLAIREASNNQTSLDTYIPYLLRMNFPNDGSLPPEFIKELADIKSNSIHQIIKKYVGELK